MRKTHAESLICPFNRSESADLKCITNRCMAWITDDHRTLNGQLLVWGRCRLIPVDGMLCVPNKEE